MTLRRKRRSLPGIGECAPEDPRTDRTNHSVTNRKITFAEAYADSQSQSFDLTAAEFVLDDQDQSKSTGVLYAACQLPINKDGELQIEPTKRLAA